MTQRTDRHLVRSEDEQEEPRLRMKGARATRPHPAASKPPELAWHDYLLLLLHVAAEIEHALMVEYLYAAYSLGGDQVPERHRRMVHRWRDSILAIAKEEMGHLLSVQNLLCLLGGPLNFDREDYPWDTPYYPFTFALEPLSIMSLSRYVFAEMPSEEAESRSWSRTEQRVVKEVRKRLKGEPDHHVGEIYESIVEIVSDKTLIPDSAFRGESIAVQASWDEWGRGYRPDPRSLDAEGNPLEPAPRPTPESRHEAHVLVTPMVTRTDAVAALREISGQGEAPHLRGQKQEELSHFERFVEIYVELEDVKGWKPTRDVPTNPTTLPASRANGSTPITDKQSRKWANLFNVRYRMLLTFLAHTFRLARSTRQDEPSVRAATMHRVFGEMYNLKTIAGMLVRLPLGRNGSDEDRAGPTFQMPYSLTLPEGDADCWRLHQDLLAGSDHLVTSLIAGASGDGERYLRTLRDLDHQAMGWIDQVLAGSRATTRHRT